MIVHVPEKLAGESYRMDFLHIAGVDAVVVFQGDRAWILTFAREAGVLSDRTETAEIDS